METLNCFSGEITYLLIIKARAWDTWTILEHQERVSMDFVREIPLQALTVLRETKQPLDKSPHGLENSKTKQLDKQKKKNTKLMKVVKSIRVKAQFSQ